MLILIQADQICGVADSTDGLPKGIKAIETTLEAPIEDLYCEGETIKLKPPQPSNQHTWVDNQWVKSIPFAFPEDALQGEDWQGLFLALHGTPIWARVYEASGRTLKANRAFTLLLNTLTTSRNLTTFVFAIADMRDALQGISAIGDFTETEIETLNQLLEQSRFELRIDG